MLVEYEAAHGSRHVPGMLKQDWNKVTGVLHALYDDLNGSRHVPGMPELDGNMVPGQLHAHWLSMKLSIVPGMFQAC